MTDAARIFVQIASFRDPECQWTIKDLFDKAENPERVFIGVCWQFVPDEDKHCFEIVTRPEQVRTLKFHAKESKGACWARHMVQKLWDGEEYTLQIDSHMRVVPGWDTKIIRMLHKCDSSKPILSTYPIPYTPPDKLDPDALPRLAAKDFSKEGILHLRGLSLSIRDAPAAPMRGAFVSAGFLFAPAEVIADVPYDPHLYFNGEEISLAARLWTSGWDPFAPNEVLIYHYYKRGEPKHWEYDKLWYLLNRRADARVRHLLGMEQSGDPQVVVELDKYGLGRARTLSDYQRYCGVNFATRAISEDAVQAVFPAVKPPKAAAQPAPISNGSLTLAPGPEEPSATAVAAHGQGSETNARIFVQIPSYRDPECQWTIKDLFEKARHPERIFVGVCWQFVPEEDKHCFEIVMRPEQVRILTFHVRDSRGTCWARHQAQGLWRGEEYSLQIDSHMRFVPGWDAKMISMLRRCESPSPVLSTYPIGYRPPNDYDNPRLIAPIAGKFDDEGVFAPSSRVIAIENAPECPIPSAFVSGGFIFASSRIIADVPYDPYLYFVGEEVSLAARLWTHGWDFFVPNEVLVYHYYARAGHPRHWEGDKEWHRLHRIAYARVRHLLGTEKSTDPAVLAELDKFGLGTARSLTEYEAYCGVDFRARTVSERVSGTALPTSEPVAGNSSGPTQVAVIPGSG